MSIACEAQASEETIISIPLSELHPFPDHPFKVRDDEAMQGMMESVREYGVLTPVIVRPREDGGYEIIAGHRRKRASEVAGLEALPAIVRDMDNDVATILMVDSNIQREKVFPSEKAYAYKMKLDAIKHQGRQIEPTSVQVAPKLSTERIGEAEGISSDTVKRYIRLTNLISEIMDMVDEKEIAITPAVELSYLKPEEQRMFLDAMNCTQAALSLSQAQQLKKLSQSGDLDAETIHYIMIGEQKPKQVPQKVPVPSKSVQQESKQETQSRSQSAPQPNTQTPVVPKVRASPSVTTSTPPKKQSRGIADDIARLKDTSKECRCTPEMFLSTFAEYVNRSSNEIEVFTIPFYEQVFPALSPEHMSDLRRQIDAIHAAADKFYENVKGKNKHESEE